jgi:hypothetical protein
MANRELYYKLPCEDFITHEVSAHLVAVHAMDISPSIIIVVHVKWVRLCLRTVVSNGPTVHPRGYIRVWSPTGMILTEENQITWRRTYPSDTLSKTNPTWIGQGANLDLHGERPATNCPSHGMALPYVITSYLLQASKTD